MLDWLQSGRVIVLVQENLELTRGATLFAIIAISAFRANDSVANACMDESILDGHLDIISKVAF